MLALGNGHVGTLDQGTQHTGIVPHQATLLAAQCGMNRWIHVHYPSADGGNVVRFANLGNAPVEGRKQRKLGMLIEIEHTVGVSRLFNASVAIKESVRQREWEGRRGKSAAAGHAQTRKTSKNKRRINIFTFHLYAYLLSLLLLLLLLQCVCVFFLALCLFPLDLSWVCCCCSLVFHLRLFLFVAHVNCRRYSCMQHTHTHAQWTHAYTHLHTTHTHWPHCTPYTDKYLLTLVGTVIFSTRIKILTFSI